MASSSIPITPELIPDNDYLFRRVHENLVKSAKFAGYISRGEVPPNVFKVKENEDGFSADWSHYADAIETLQRKNANPDINGVFEMKVGEVSDISPLTVHHNPKPRNKAHSLIKGIPFKGATKNLIRMKLHRISRWAISIPSLVQDNTEY